MSKNRWRLLASVLACVVGLLPGPGCEDGHDSGKLAVVATTGMIADLASQVAGDLADVESLMGPGVDPHLYKPSQGDVGRLADAGLILYNGLHLEGKMGDILERLSAQRPVVAVAEVIPPARLTHPQEFQGQADPHVWFDVSLWSLVLAPLELELSRLLPQHAATFRANAERMRLELAALEEEIRAEIVTLPKDARVLVTAHDAFGYFGRRYGFEVVALQGISTVAEAGIQDVNRVVDLIVSRSIKAIFVEASVPRRSIVAVQEACRAKGHDVRVGGELFSDSMGAAGTEAGTYVGMVRHNVHSIVRALR